MPGCPRKRAECQWELVRICYGKPGQNNDPEILEDLKNFIQVCNKYGVAPGIHLYDMKAAKSWIDLGMRLICYSNDISMIVDTGSSYTAELKDYIKGGTR